jgi:hypothetical protein
MGSTSSSDDAICNSTSDRVSKLEVQAREGTRRVFWLKSARAADFDGFELRMHD